MDFLTIWIHLKRMLVRQALEDSLIFQVRPPFWKDLWIPAPRTFIFKQNIESTGWNRWYVAEILEGSQVGNRSREIHVIAAKSLQLPESYHMRNNPVDGYIRYIYHLLQIKPFLLQTFTKAPFPLRGPLLRQSSASRAPSMSRKPLPDRWKHPRFFSSEQRIWVSMYTKHIDHLSCIHIS